MPVAVVVVPLVVLAATSRWRSLVFLVASAPFLTLDVVEAVGHPFNLPEIALLVVLARESVGWLRRGQVPVGDRRTFGWLVAFAAVCLLSVCYAAVRPVDAMVFPYNNSGTFLTGEYRPFAFDTENVTQLLLRLFFVGGVLAVASAVRDAREVRRLLRLFVLTAVAVGVAGVAYQALTALGVPFAGPLRWFGFDRVPSAPAYYGPLPRMYSFPGEPGFTADYLLYGLAVVTTVYVSGRPAGGAFTRREAAALTVALGGFLLLSTGTTGFGGLLILGGVLAVVTALSGWTDRSVAARTLAALAAVAAVAMVVDAFLLGGRLWSLLAVQIQKVTFTADRGSAPVRLRHAARSLELVRARPLFGVGVGSHAVPMLLSTVLAEVGLVGFATYLGVHVSLFGGCVGLYRAGDDRGDLAFALAVAGTTLLLTNLVAKSVATLILPWYWLSLALPLAVLSAAARDRPAAAPAPSGGATGDRTAGES